MTAQLSRERLERVVKLKDVYDPELTKAMARMLLAGMEQTPFMYGIADPDGEAHFDECCVSKSIHGVDEAVSYLNAEYTEEGAPLYQIVPLYRQPMLPAPVAVPDEQHSERFDWSYEDWANHLGGRYQNNDPACYYEFGSFVAVAEMLRQFGNVQRKVGWNACRAAMQAEPVTAATAPAGWKLMPVEPTEAMLDAAYSHPASTEDRMRKQYASMLAAAPAAPEQEV